MQPYFLFYLVKYIYKFSHLLQFIFEAIKIIYLVYDLSAKIIVNLGFVAAAEIGIDESVIRAVSKRVANTSIIVRLRFMEPPGPLA